MKLRPSRLFAAAVILASAVLTAHAAQPTVPSTTAEALLRVPPQHRDWIRRELAQHLSSSAIRSQAATDTTPPAFTSFNAVSAVDVTIPESRITVAFKASDDLSGVQAGFAWATSPSGHDYQVSFWNNLPATGLSGKMVSTQALSPFMEPGTYTFTGAFVIDVAGNNASFDAFDLAAVGRTTFVVKNKKGFDTTRPTLSSGTVVTPVVSLAALQPGTNQLPFVGIVVKATDSGNTAVAGVWGINARYCQLDGSGCFDLLGTDAVEARQALLTMRLGHQLALADKVGEYHLYSVYMFDYAGNSQVYVSTEFQGETDFGAYFASGSTITVVP
jgi:hypothetical protein